VAIRSGVDWTEETTTASTRTFWPELDEDSLDPGILGEMEPDDPPEDEGEEDEGSESAVADFGQSEDDDE
jgi:hypothetical protein